MADSRTPRTQSKAAGTLDMATVIGLIGAFGLISVAIIIGGSPGSFVNLPSFLIVIGGTAAITTMCFSITEMKHSVNVAAKAIFYTTPDATDAATQVLTLAESARRRGVLTLQDSIDSLKSKPFLYKGMNMVIDGSSGEEVEYIMRRDLNATVLRHNKSASVLRKAAEFAPAMGLIGTLIGLVQMLGNLEDPSTIGPSMAVALLTTFYGAVLANLVFMPLASKLERNSDEEKLVNTIYLMGATSIGRQENPRRLEMLLNSILPPAQRVRYFE